MAIITISDEEARELMDMDFLDEEDTEPLLLMTVQEQLNSAESVAGFTAHAFALRPVPAEDMSWTDRLDLELDDVDLVDVIGVEYR